MNPIRPNAFLKITLLVAAGLCVFASLYCFMAVLQAASLFTDRRALINVNLWSSLSLIFGFCAVCLFKAVYPVVKNASPIVSAAWTLLWSAIFLAAAWELVIHFFEVDRCLDRGGSFDYVNAKCDLRVSHSKLSIYETHGFLLVVAALAFTQGLVWLNQLRKKASQPAAKRRA
jgi:hypothetical protein